MKKLDKLKLISYIKKKVFSYKSNNEVGQIEVN